MFSTVFALITLVVFILPGFVTLRIAAGRRATPAKLGDLELVLRALGYSLAFHAGFALTGWTASLVSKVDESGAWANHVDDLALFGATVLGTATVFGGLLYWLFEKLQQYLPTSRCAQGLFHLLGGEDVRDGFDYIFARRKELGKDFIVLAHTDGEDGARRHVGRYGNKSYVGVSPRPHDLYLEEMWQDTDEGPRRPEGSAEGAWFAANSIKDLRFRDLPDEDKQAGATRRIGIDEAIRRSREAVADQIAQAVLHLARDLDNVAQLRADFDDALTQTVDAAQDAPDSDAPMDELYSYWTGPARRAMLELAAIGSALAAAQRAHSAGTEPRPFGTDYIYFAIESGQHRLRVPTEPRDIWIRTLEHRAAWLRESALGYQEFIGMLGGAIWTIDNADWDFGD